MPPLGAFVAYKGKAPRQTDGSDALPAGFNVGIDDAASSAPLADDPENYTVKGAAGLALPAASGTAAAAGDPALHYVRFALREAREGAAPAGPDGRFSAAARHIPRRWSLGNELGPITVDSRKVTALLVPAGAGLAGPAAAIAAQTHFVCYSVAAAPGVAGPQVDASGRGRLRRNLQTFAADTFADCATFADGATPAWGATAAVGRCLFDLRSVAELCTPATVGPVTGGRFTTAAIGTSTPTTAQALLCYRAKTATGIADPAVAAVLGLAPGDGIPGRQKQAKHARRTKKAGTQVRLAPGNGFPAPAEIDTLKAESVCLPTNVLGVSPLP